MENRNRTVMVLRNKWEREGGVEKDRCGRYMREQRRT